MPRAKRPQVHIDMSVDEAKAHVAAAVRLREVLNEVRYTRWQDEPEALKAAINRIDRAALPLLDFADAVRNGIFEAQ